MIRQNTLRQGLYIAIAAVVLVFTGIITAFEERNVIDKGVTLSTVMLLALFIGVGYVTARRSNQPGTVARTANGIAGSLVGRAYAADPVLLSDLVGEALDAVGGASREVEVRLHPDDIQSLAPLLALVSGARLVPDPTLGRGDLRVHAESVRIDGTLEARLRGALENVIRKAGAGA